MKQSRKNDLRHMALRECAEIIASSLDVDLGIFSEETLNEEEAAFVESIMRKVSDDLYKRSDAVGKP